MTVTQTDGHRRSQNELSARQPPSRLRRHTAQGARGLPHSHWARAGSSESEMQQQLNPNIELAPSLTATLNPEVIDIVNEVGCAVKSDFPGLIVQLGKEEDIHRALSLEGSPIPQGDDEHESTHAFKCWLASTAAVVPTQCVP